MHKDQQIGQQMQMQIQMQQAFIDITWILLCAYRLISTGFESYPFTALLSVSFRVQNVFILFKVVKLLCANKIKFKVISKAARTCDTKI